MTDFEPWADRIIGGLSDPDDIDPEIALDGPGQQDESESIDLWSGWDELDSDGKDAPHPERLWGEEYDHGALDVPEVDDSDRIWDAAAAEGFAVFAFYKSIHFKAQRPFPGLWGIFVHDWAVGCIQQQVLQYHRHFPLAQPLSVTDAQLFARRMLFRHEFYHFRVDAWTLAIEAALGAHRYALYNRQIYRRVHPGLLCVEESLANRHLWNNRDRLLRNCRGFLTDFMDCQPGAYACYKRHPRCAGGSQSLPDFLRGQLALQVVDLRATFGQTRSDLAPFVAEAPPTVIKKSNCPFYIVRGTNPNRFLPPFRGLPTVDEMERFVTDYLDGKPVSSSDHRKRRLDNGETVKLPNPHSNEDRAKPWEFLNILRRAGLRSPEYYTERERTKTWRRNVPRGTIRLGL
jgi:hypothetical protein